VIEWTKIGGNMVIVVEMAKANFANSLIKDISEQYPDKVYKAYPYKREIIFKSGDILKAVSNESRIDGIYADVAIGEHAQYITCRSKESKRIWDYNDLIAYLKA
jgi:hypothetical protein